MAKKAIDELAGTLGASAAVQDPMAALALIKCVDARLIKQIAQSEGVKTYIVKSALAAAKHAAEESLAAGTRSAAELNEVKLSAEVLEEV